MFTVAKEFVLYAQQYFDIRIFDFQTSVSIVYKYPGPPNAIVSRQERVFN